MEEIWRDIPGLEGRYQISISTKEGKCRSLNYNNTGQVKELKNTIDKRDGRIYWKLPKTHQAARWIAITYPEFVQNEWFEGAFIDHIDTDPANDAPENLRWVAGNKGNMENTKTRENMRRSKIGNKNALGHKLSKETKNTIAEKNGKKVGQYSLDGLLICTYPSTKEAWRQTGINQSNINQCCLNRPHYHTAGGFIWQFIS